MAPRALLALALVAPLLLAPAGCGALPAGNKTQASRPQRPPSAAAAAAARKRTEAKYGVAALAAPGAPSLQQLADKWRLTHAQAAAIGKPGMAGRMRICVDPYTPYVFCDRTQPQDTYSGYYVEVFRELAQRVPWLEDFDSWFLDCMDWTPMYEDLKSPNGSCMLSPSGIGASDDLFASGASLSWVIDKEGVKILTVPSNHFVNIWAPLSVFSPALWVLLFCTSVLVGLMLWTFDRSALALLKPPPTGALKQRPGARRRLAALLRGRRAAAPAKGAGGEGAGAKAAVREALRAPGGGGGGGSGGGLLAGGGDAGAGAAAGSAQLGEDALLDVDVDHFKDQDQEPQLERSASVLRWLGVRQGEEKAAMSDLRKIVSEAMLLLPRVGSGAPARTLPARILLFAYGLLLLIIAALYTANAAALLTARLNSNIRGLSDLHGKSVGVWDQHLPKARSLGLTAVGLKWEDVNDEQAMLEMLRAGQVKALVLYSSFVDWAASQHCDLAAVGDQFAVVDDGIGFQRNLSPLLRQSLDMSLATMVEEGVVETLYNANVKQKGGGCTSLHPAVQTQVTPGQVAGLWVLLGLSAALAVGVLCTYALRRHAKYVHTHVQRHALQLLPTGIARRPA